MLRRFFTDTFLYATSLRLKLLGALIYLVILTLACLCVGDEFPFSNFPMYGNPNGKPVDYFFLTDATGNPLSINDYAGITAPQVKKRMNTALGKSPMMANGQPSQEAKDKAAALLLRMREEAAQKPQALLSWPAGVQMKQAIILTKPNGFQEKYFTMASLPDAGPATKGHAQRLSAELRDSFRGMVENMAKLLVPYGYLVGVVALLLAGRRWLPARLQAGLFQTREKFGLSWLEAFALRFGLAVIVWQCLTVRVDYDALPHPVGLARFFPEATLWFGDAAHWATMQTGVAILLVWYVIGWAPLLPITAITIIHCLARGLYASQGAPHHGQNMVALAFLAQMLVVWWQVGRRFWKKDLRDLRGNSGKNVSSHWQTQLLFISATVAAAYVITFVTKMIESNGKWVKNAPYFSNQIVKTYRQNYYNDLNPRYISGVPLLPMETPDPENDRYRHPVPPQSQWLITHQSAARWLFSGGLLIEATALFLLFGRGLSFCYGVAIIAFHVLVLYLMELTFPENIAVVVVVLLNVPGWLIRWFHDRKQSLETQPTLTS